MRLPFKSLLPFGKGDPSHAATTPADTSDGAGGLFPMSIAAAAAESALTEAGISARSWQFERSDGELIAKYLRLLPGGRMSGFRYENEYRWAWENGRVVFFNDAAQRTTIFADARCDEQDRYVLSGNFLLPPYQSTTHVLRQIEPLGVPPPDNGAAVGLTGAPSGRRRNLVILRANEMSLHNEWARDVAESDRTWDLCVSYYGSEDHLPGAGAQEFLVHQPQFRKFSAIHQLFFKGSPLWDYDFIMLPDDDLMLTWQDLNRSFDLCREHRLELAQPSLREGSYWGLEFVLQQPGSLLRYTSFVESMMPIFSREALEICVGTFPQSLIGWGLDMIWPVMIGSRRTSIAILDTVSVLHTRPVGATYNGTEADASGLNVVQLYGVKPQIVEYGRLPL